MTERGSEHGVRPAGAFDPTASAGLFVGVSTFEDAQIARVPYAVDDAIDLAHLFALELRLVAPEKTVLLLAGEPQKDESRERLAALRAAGVREGSALNSEIYRFLPSQANAAGAGGLFLLSVATHGLSDQGSDFFLATNSVRRHLQRTGVVVSDVFDEVSRSSSGRALVFLDTCRERLTEETRGAQSAGMTESFEKAMSSAEGVVVLLGTTLGGFSYDDPELRNGVFTAAVLDGLKGKAPAAADGWITVRTLADYVHERVKAWVRKYRPADVGRSKGIGRKVDGAAEGIPLAPHAGALEKREKDRARRAAALRKMALVVSDSAILDESHWGFVKKRLAAEEGGAESERILRAIEAMNEEEDPQRSFRDLLWELSGGRVAAAAQDVPQIPAEIVKPAVPAAPVVVSAVQAVAAIPRTDQVGRAVGRRSPWWKSPTAVWVAVGLVIFVGLLVAAWLSAKKVEPVDKNAVQETPLNSGAEVEPLAETLTSETGATDEKQDEPAKAAADAEPPTTVDTAKSLDIERAPIVLGDSTKLQPDPATTRAASGPPKTIDPAKDSVVKGDEIAKGGAAKQAPEPRDFAVEVAEPAPGAVLVGPHGMRFRWVPKGTYKIGSPKGEPGRDDGETRRDVTLANGLWLGETEVTQEQWNQLVPKTFPWYFKKCGANCPVERVNWYEALAFANRLSARENLSPCYRLEGPTGGIGEGLTFKTTEILRPCVGYRLPSEEEWEVAARAGTSGSTYSENLSSIAWFDANGEKATHPVGQKLRNDWGFSDMLGNVWEWTESEGGRDRVFRGGSWYSDARNVRAASRVGARPSYGWDGLGFRLARGQGSAQ